MKKLIEAILFHFNSLSNHTLIENTNNEISVSDYDIYYHEIPFKQVQAAIVVLDTIATGLSLLILFTFSQRLGTYHLSIMMFL